MTDGGGSLSYAAIVGRGYGLLTVAGTGEVIKKIKTGDRVRADGDNRCVYTIRKRGKQNKPRGTIVSNPTGKVVTMAVLDLFSLDGQVALITGAGSGLGRAMAKAMAEAGADVACIGRREYKVQETVEAIRGLGRRGLAISADVAKEADVKRMVDETVAEFDRLDIVIANAGAPGREGLWPNTEVFQSKLDTDLTGTWFTIREAARVMMPQKRGKIITIASTVALAGDPHGTRPGYSAAKAGIIALTRNYAIGLAPYGIQLNCIVPGPFITGRSAVIFFEATDEETKQYAAEFIQHVPQHRLAEPEEIKGLALFLASPASSFVTGAIIPIDGGYLAW